MLNQTRCRPLLSSDLKMNESSRPHDHAASLGLLLLYKDCVKEIPLILDDVFLVRDQIPFRFKPKKWNLKRRAYNVD